MGPISPWAPWGPMGPHGGQCSQFSNIWKNFFRKKYPKIQNVNFGGENQSCSRRNSAHVGTHTVPWGPLFDHFPGFNNFVKIGQNGPIPQTVQIWPSGQVCTVWGMGPFWPILTKLLKPGKWTNKGPQKVWLRRICSEFRRAISRPSASLRGL